MKPENKVFDLICFVVGPFLTTVSVLSFGSGYAYEYHWIAKLIAGLGVAVICTGFLEKHWQRNQDK